MKSSTRKNWTDNNWKVFLFAVACWLLFSFTMVKIFPRPKCWTDADYLDYRYGHVKPKVCS